MVKRVALTHHFWVRILGGHLKILTIMNRILPIKFMATIEQQFKELIEFVEEVELTNDQTFLDFMDRMNKLSVKY